MFGTLAWAAAPGKRDRSFSGNGVGVTNIGGIADSASWGGLDSKGRIVAVGFALYRHDGVDTSKIGVTRYKRDGRLDSRFSGNGKLHLGLEAGNLLAHAGAIDGRGRILAAGGSCADATFEEGCRFVLARFEPSGKIDGSFGGDGSVLTAFPGDAQIESMALYRGKIVVGGFAGDELVLARYERDGRLDPSFGDGGIVTKDLFPGDDRADAIAIDAKGMIVVVGSDTELMRFKPDGRLDRRFGHGGTAPIDFGGDSLAIGKRGCTVVGGSRQEGTGGDRRYRFMVTRYLPNGRPDRSFSHNGKVKTTFSGFRDEATAVTIDSHGRVVAAGFATSYDLAIARYDPEGGLDRSFGKDGKVREKIGTVAIPNSVLTDRRDRIIPVGYIRGRFGVARYIGYRQG